MADSAKESPLTIPLYRSLWIATIASNIGTWMNDVGAGWLMTSLSTSPLLVALVQAATTLPMALLALPGGALADIVDRRRLMLGAQLWSLTAAATLSLLTLTGQVNSYLLLIVVFAMACGSAVSAPAYQALISELVPRQVLPQAITLGGLGVNIARAVGPALGGLIIALAGPGWVFLLNALSYLGTITILARWRREPLPNPYPPEHLVAAIRAGFRYVRMSEELRVAVIRAIGFFIFASATWSLLPVLARRELGFGPTGYGALLACIGAGAIAGAIALPKLRGSLSVNRLTGAAALLLAGAMGALSLTSTLALALLCAILVGIAWIVTMANFQSAVQFNAPAWVKARSLGMFLFVFQGSMALGAALWGSVALTIGVRQALLAAAVLLAIGQLLAFRFRLVVESGHDLSPSRHWPMPVLEQAMSGDEGPVLVSIEYRIAPSTMSEFVVMLLRLRDVRLRDGAMQWGFWRDTADSSRVLEEFRVASWLEHLRQHERVTHADRLLQEQVARLHIGSDPPLVRHWVAAR